MGGDCLNRMRLLVVVVCVVAILAFILVPWVPVEARIMEGELSSLPEPVYGMLELLQFNFSLSLVNCSFQLDVDFDISWCFTSGIMLVDCDIYQSASEGFDGCFHLLMENCHITASDNNSENGFTADIGVVRLDILVVGDGNGLYVVADSMNHYSPLELAWNFVNNL